MWDPQGPVATRCLMPSCFAGVRFPPQPFWGEYWGEQGYFRVQSGALAIEEAWKNLRKTGKNRWKHVDLLGFACFFFYHCGSHPFGEVVFFAVPAIIVATKRVTQMEIIMEVDASRDVELPSSCLLVNKKICLRNPRLVHRVRELLGGFTGAWK